MKTKIKTNKDTKITLDDKTISIKDCFGTSSAKIDKLTAEKLVYELQNKFNLK